MQSIECSPATHTAIPSLLNGPDGLPVNAVHGSSCLLQGSMALVVFVASPIAHRPVVGNALTEMQKTKRSSETLPIVAQSLSVNLTLNIQSSQNKIKADIEVKSPLQYQQRRRVLSARQLRLPRTGPSLLLLASAIDELRSRSRTVDFRLLVRTAFRSRPSQSRFRIETLSTIVWGNYSCSQSGKSTSECTL